MALADKVPYLNDITSLVNARNTRGVTDGIIVEDLLEYTAIHSAAQSYLIAFIVITLMMVFLVGSLRLGTLCMLPNLLTILAQSRAGRTAIATC